MINLYSMNDLKSKFSWNFIYFHNKAEDIIDEKWNSDNEWCPPDLIGSDISIDAIKDGIYDVNVYNISAKLFIWSCGISQFLDDSGEEKEVFPGVKMKVKENVMRHGLVVLKDDVDAFNYANKKFLEKASIL